jgi:hypothetical protein
MNRVLTALSLTAAVFSAGAAFAAGTTAKKESKPEMKPVAATTKAATRTMAKAHKTKARAHTAKKAAPAPKAHAPEKK